MAVSAFIVRLREPFEDGHPFGDGGAYERIEGTLQFAVDPIDAANLTVLRPADAAARWEVFAPAAVV